MGAGGPHPREGTRGTPACPTSGPGLAVGVCPWEEKGTMAAQLSPFCARHGAGHRAWTG